MTKIKDLILLLSMLCISCSNTKNNIIEDEIPNSSIIGEVKIDDDLKLMLNNQNPNNIKLDIDYIQLESNSECLIGEIDKIYWIDSLWVVFDKYKANSIFVYDNHGKFKNKIGRRGKGVGEFLYVSDICVDENRKNVYVYDNKIKKLITFTLDNSVVKEIKVPFNAPSFIYLNERFYFNLNKYPNLDKYKYHIISMNEKGLILNKFIPYNDIDVLTRNYLPHTAISSNKIIDNNLVLFSCIFRSDIFCINSEKPYRYLNIQHQNDISGLNISQYTNKENIRNFVTNLRASKVETHYSTIFFTDQYVVFNVLHPKPTNLFYSFEEQNIVFGLDRGFAFSLSMQGDLFSDKILGVHGNYFFTCITSQSINYFSSLVRRKNDTTTLNYIKNIIPDFSINNNPILIKYKINEF